MNYFRLASIISCIAFSVCTVLPLQLNAEVAMYPTDRSLPANISFESSPTFQTEFINSDQNNDATLLIQNYLSQTKDGFLFPDTSVDSISNDTIAISPLTSYTHTQNKQSQQNQTEVIYVTTYTDISMNTSGVSAQSRTGIRTYSMDMDAIQRDVSITNIKLIPPTEGLEFSPQGNIIAMIDVTNNGNIFEELSLSYQLNTSQTTLQSTTSIVIQPKSTQSIPLRMNTQWQPGQVELSIDVSALPLNPFVRDSSAYPEYQSSIENLISEPIQAITQTVTASYTPTNTEYNNYITRVNEYTNSPSQNTPPYIDIELYVWIAVLIVAFILVGYNLLIYTSRNRT